MEDDKTCILIQDEYDPLRFKFIGLAPCGVIAVITDDSGARIITAWHASTAEVKEWLQKQ